jgi:hypothetical protein
MDVGNRFLPCMFNELVDFVEIESAWSHIAWGDKEARAKYDPPFWASGWFRWRTWRCPQAGLDHLDWAMTLTMGSDWGVEEDNLNFGKPTGQAIRAKELKELYVWWTVTYPNRPDPYDVSGWTEYCEKSRLLNDGRLFGNKKTPELEELSTRSHELLQKIEADYTAEDEAMMIRLIKARDSLWT